MPQRPCHQPAPQAPGGRPARYPAYYPHTCIPPRTSMRLRVLSERKYGYADTCSVSSMHSSTHGYLVTISLPAIHTVNGDVGRLGPGDAIACYAYAACI